MASADTLLGLAQRSTSTPMTLEQAYDRVATASHEAAHLLGALAVRARVSAVFLHRPNSKRGKGGIHACAVLPAEDALISLMGVAHARAWGLEEGTAAGSDLLRGQAECREARVDPDQVLEIAADLLATCENTLHDLTAAILEGVNRQGVLRERKLGKLMARTLAYVPDLRARLGRLERRVPDEVAFDPTLTREFDLLLGVGTAQNRS